MSNETESPWQKCRGEKMSREEAIEYLNRKGKLESVKYSGALSDKTEKQKIESDESMIGDCQLSGMVYGDPIATVQFRTRREK